MNIWYVEFPTHKYNEDVVKLARQNELKIIDAKFQGKNKQCDNAPSLTVKGAKPKRTRKVKETITEDGK